MDSASRAQSESERRREIVGRVLGGTASRTGRIDASAPLVRLASKLGVSVNTLVVGLDPDVVRRTKNPVLEEVDAEGKITYRAPAGVIDGIRSSRG